MRKLKLLTFFLFGGGLSLLMAQQPSLTQKKDLPVTLLQDKSITTSSVDIFKTTDITPPADGNYTLEVLTRVNHTDGRGLDVETSDTGGKGFRASVNTQSLSWSNPLQSIESIITSGTIDQKLRFVVEDNNVHIYKNGYYITTRAKELVNVLIDGQEYDPFSSIANNGDQTNLISNAIPADYWWGGSKPTPQSHGWQLYNNGIYKDSWPNSRFENSPNTYALNNYSGNFFFVRWDSNNNNTDYYAYPVQLEANTTYLFSMDLAYWSNYNSSNPANISDKAVRVAISKDGGSTQELSNKKFYCYEAKDLIPDSFGFTTQEAGTYYLTFTGGWGMYAIANLNLIEATAEARIIVGKNYEGDADILIKSVTYDADGAFAPVPDGTMPQESLNLSDVNLSYLTFINTNISLSGKSELHLVSDSHPLQNSTVDLSGTEAWLYFDKVKPSDVIAGYLPLITIDKLPASQNNNIRVAQWGNGTVIIPYGNETMAAAMTVFDEENCQGNSQTFGINTYYNELNDWDNKIKSFILKKGYSATLANNASGTGYSRVFIASDEDLIVNVLPEGLVTKEGDTKSFVSFVRVFKWEWVGKKGWSGGVGMPSIMNPACSYDWNCDAYTGNPDVEYTPMRHNLGWPDFNHINRVNNVSHVLGFNEPDRDDQSDATVDETIMQWPDLFKSGLRIGSPAPSSVWTWIEGFMKTADSLNYRVDFMVAHIYEENLNASSWESRVRTLSNKGDGRPVWITEWNNGANWTNEYWPTASGPTCDAETNIIYDENGNTTTINRPLSPENAAKQLAFMEEILPAMDEMELLERHFFYNWVQDARAVELGGKLTPAGKLFIETEVSGDIIIYNLQGMQIRSIKLNTGVNIIEDLIEGVYIVGTTKIKL